MIINFSRYLPHSPAVQWNSSLTAYMASSLRKNNDNRKEACKCVTNFVKESLIWKKKSYGTTQRMCLDISAHLQRKCRAGILLNVKTNRNENDSTSSQGLPITSWRMLNSVQSKAASSSVGSSRRGPRLTKRMFALPAVANRLYEDGFNSVRRINSLLCVSRHGNRLRVQGVFLSETDNPEFPSFRGYQTQSFHWTCFLKQTPLVV